MTTFQNSRHRSQRTSPSLPTATSHQTVPDSFRMTKIDRPIALCGMAFVNSKTGRALTPNIYCGRPR